MISKIAKKSRIAKCTRTVKNAKDPNILKTATNTSGRIKSEKFKNSENIKIPKNAKKRTKY